MHTFFSILYCSFAQRLHKAERMPATQQCNDNHKKSYISSLFHSFNAKEWKKYVPGRGGGCLVGLGQRTVWYECGPSPELLVLWPESEEATEPADRKHMPQHSNRKEEKLKIGIEKRMYFTCFDVERYIPNEIISIKQVLGSLTNNISLLSKPYVLLNFNLLRTS